MQNCAVLHLEHLLREPLLLVDCDLLVRVLAELVRVLAELVRVLSELLVSLTCLEADEHREQPSSCDKHLDQPP